MEVLQCILAVLVYAALCAGLFLAGHAIRAHTLGWVTAKGQWSGWRSAGSWLGWRIAAILLSLLYVVVLFAPLYVPLWLSGWAFPAAGSLLTGIWVVTMPAILLGIGGGRTEHGD